MMSNELNVAIRERIDIVTMAGAIIGRVMRRNRYQRPAPSAQAASYRSRGTDCTAASR